MFLLLRHLLLKPLYFLSLACDNQMETTDHYFLVIAYIMT